MLFILVGDLNPIRLSSKVFIKGKLADCGTLTSRVDCGTVFFRNRSRTSRVPNLMHSVHVSCTLLGTRVTAEPSRRTARSSAVGLFDKIEVLEILHKVCLVVLRGLQEMTLLRTSSSFARTFLVPVADLLADSASSAFLQRLNAYPVGLGTTAARSWKALSSCIAPGAKTTSQMPMFLRLVDGREGSLARWADLVLHHRRQDLLGLLFVEDLLWDAVLGGGGVAVLKLAQSPEKNLELTGARLIPGTSIIIVVISDALHEHRCMGLRSRLALGLPVQVRFVDSDPFLHRLGGELPLRVVQKELDLVATKLQGHNKEKPEVLRREGNAVLPKATNLIVPSREEQLMAFSFCPPKGVGDLHKSVQHVLPGVLAVELLGVHLSQEQLAVLIVLHPGRVLGQVLKVVKGGSGQALQQHRSSGLRSDLRSRQPEFGPDVVVPEAALPVPGRRWPGTGSLAVVVSVVVVLRGPSRSP